MVRLCVLGVIALILLIPVSMIRSLVSERQQRHIEAAAEVTSKWGRSQTLVGPALVVPYTFRENQRTETGIVTRETVRHAIFLPKRLKTTGTLNVEVRSRGIFDVPVYVLTLTIDGEFENPKPEQLGIDPKDVDWNHAHFSMGISDVRALVGSSSLAWNGAMTDFLPGTGGLSEAPQGVHAPVRIQPGDSPTAFSFPLTLHGSESVFVVPFAEETLLQLSSNFPHPNFQGNWLPSNRTITGDGFEAIWQVSYLGRNYPQAWRSGGLPRTSEELQAQDALPKVIANSQFGVTLNDPVDRYRLADRSVKYAGLFILLTFASVWLVEVLARQPVHPVQSLLLGASLCMFYLLELSLSEHILFSAAYAIASVAVITMIAFYCRTIFRRNGRAGLVAGGVTLLYAYLYVVLTNEDAALLVGSVGVFLILAVIMFMTRRVRWYNTDMTGEPGESDTVLME